ncbi:uncharacterized protein FPRN_09466 [Fusarium proliferatum]|nr:uncharacterized protein FPRN_09466 [Fusarium proliferatum]
MPTTSSMSRGATRFALRDINTFKVAHLAQACESGKPKINFLIQGNAHPSEKEKMLKDHQQQLGKIDQKYRGEGRHPDHQGDGVMGADSFGLNISSPNDRDSYLEAGDEWEDVVPKSEKMEEHFAYVQAATSLQHSTSLNALARIRRETSTAQSTGRSGDSRSCIRNRHLATRLCFLGNGLLNMGFDYDPIAVDTVDSHR